LTGLYAAYGILGALYERDKRDDSKAKAKGRRVEVSMFEAMTHFNLDAFTHLFSEGEVMGPYSRPSVSQSYVLECADGKWIALHMSSPPKFWEGLAKAIDQPDLFDDPRFATREARIEHQEVLIGVLGGFFAKRNRDAWCARLAALDVPHAPMYDTNEAPQDPQARHLQLFVDAPHPGKPGERWTTVRSPVSFDGQRDLDVRAPPLLGDHDAALRSGASIWEARAAGR
jgi:crotonobetainyl-CoA:carnitine CoA-transferase CaiB-like acyl-CoA transferase